jgi:hypothetical protein
MDDFFVETVSLAFYCSLHVLDDNGKARSRQQSMDEGRLMDLMDVSIC